MIHTLAADLGTESGTGFRTALSDQDVRKRLDYAVRRGWAAILRRFARRAVLFHADLFFAVCAALGALMAVGEPLDSLAAIASSTRILLFVVCVQPFLLGATGAYRSGSSRTDLRRLGTGSLLGGVLGAFQAIVLGIDVSLVLFALYGVLAAAFIYFGRVSIDRVVQVAYRHGIGARRVLVVGTEEEATRLKESFESEGGADLHIVGRLAPSPDQREGALGTVLDLEKVLTRSRARGVLIASNLDFESLETLSRECFMLGASVSVIPRTLHQVAGNVEVRGSRAGVILQLYPRGFGLPQLATKRAIDIVLCSVLIFFIWPLLVGIAVAIRLDSPGPVLFRQKRAGVGGRPFSMFKFRTMKAGADQMKLQLQHLNITGDPRLFKIKADPRVTRIGSFLRRTSLDELPQLLNVLRGEMSLVGPRPFFPHDLDQYEDHHFERLFVLPGITGLWQVSGRSDVIDFEEVVRLDSHYIRNWSVIRDLVILLRTIPAALGREGAH